MPNEMSTSSNTTPSNTFTQEQLQEAAGVFRGAAFDFYEAYVNTYNVAIQAGVNAQQAAINGLDQKRGRSPIMPNYQFYVF